MGAKTTARHSGRWSSTSAWPGWSSPAILAARSAGARPQRVAAPRDARGGGHPRLPPTRRKYSSPEQYLFHRQAGPVVNTGPAPAHGGEGPARHHRRIRRGARGTGPGRRPDWSFTVKAMAEQRVTNHRLISARSSWSPSSPAFSSDGRARPDRSKTTSRGAAEQIVLLRSGRADHQEEKAGDEGDHDERAEIEPVVRHALLRHGFYGEVSPADGLGRATSASSNAAAAPGRTFTTMSRGGPMFTTGPAWRWKRYCSGDEY